MIKYPVKLIVCGVALLLFGVILAVNGNPALSCVVGGLGLFLAIIGCFAKEDSGGGKP